MFNFFKSSNEIVAEIHNEFDTAQDRLLQEAKNILSTTLENEIADFHEKLGFVNSETVITNKSNKRIIVESKKQAEIIEYYKTFYPFQKFITEKELDRICEKYGLIYAPVSNYKKDVPTKNLLEIRNCHELKSVDLPKDNEYSILDYDGSSLNIGSKEALKIGLPSIINKHFDSWVDADIYLKSKYPQVSGRMYIVNSVKNITERKNGLFIAAPKSHFNLKDLKKSGLFGFLNVTITEVKDPIVFRYCRGGIQIISKWGLEASDEIVVNQKMN